MYKNMSKWEALVFLLCWALNVKVLTPLQLMIVTLMRFCINKNVVCFYMM